MSLKNLKEWNAEQGRIVRNMKSIPNGIACPKCGKELCDRDRSRVLPSDPPKLDVFCPACKYSGYRVQ